jgi:DNA-binding NarL/FixJ family response regulator
MKINNQNKYHLTERELEVLKLLSKAYTNPQIAKELCISTHTAKAHVCAILHKMKVEDRVKAIVKCIEEGLVKG